MGIIKIFFLSFLIFSTEVAFAMASRYQTILYDTEEIQSKFAIARSSRCYLANTDVIPGPMFYAYRSKIKEIMEPINQEMTNLAKMSDDLLRVTREYRAQVTAECTLDFIYEWAIRQSMTEDFLNYRHVEDLYDQPEYEREHLTVILLLSYSKVKNFKKLSVGYPEKKSVIEDYLGTLAMRVKEYSLRRANYRDGIGLNNHLYWEGLSSLIYGYMFDDSSHINHAKWVYDIALDQIQPNGTLPLEMDRGEKAYQYHLYALKPLMMMGVLAARNGENLFSRQQYKLLKLVNMIGSTWDYPAYFQKLFGFSDQTVTPDSLKVVSNRQGWFIAAFDAYYKDFSRNPYHAKAMGQIWRMLKNYHDLNDDRFSRRLAGSMKYGMALDTLDNPFSYLSFVKENQSNPYWLKIRYLNPEGQLVTNLACITNKVLQSYTAGFPFRYQCEDGSRWLKHNESTEMSLCHRNLNTDKVSCTSWKKSKGTMNQIDF